MYLLPKLGYILFSFINNGIILSLVLGSILVLLLIPLIIMTIWNPLFALVIGYGTFMIIYLSVALSIITGQCIYNMVLRFRDPYEPYGTLSVIIQEFPIINGFYRLVTILNSPFGSKIDSLSY